MSARPKLLFFAGLEALNHERQLVEAGVAGFSSAH
jgi:hypothetical protein